MSRWQHKEYEVSEETRGCRRALGCEGHPEDRQRLQGISEGTPDKTLPGRVLPRKKI